MENISKVLINLYRGTDNHETWVLACLSGMWVQDTGREDRVGLSPRALPSRMSDA